MEPTGVRSLADADTGDREVGPAQASHANVVDARPSDLSAPITGAPSVQTVFADAGSLCIAIAESTSGIEGAVVGLEGYPLAGKSTLARTTIAPYLRAMHIATDSYVRKARDAATYVGYIDLDELRRDIAAARTRGVVVVEGICLRDVLHASALEADIFVYCKRITELGLWADDPENYDPPESFSAFSFADSQAHEYHLREHPAERADFVFLRREREDDIANDEPQIL